MADQQSLDRLLADEWDEPVASVPAEDDELEELISREMQPLPTNQAILNPSHANARRLIGERTRDDPWITFSDMPTHIQELVAKSQRNLDGDQLLAFRMRKAQIREMSKMLKKIHRAPTSCAPQRCVGVDCTNAMDCPLLAAGIPPLGEPCPIEEGLIDDWAKDYRKSIFEARRGQPELVDVYEEDEDGNRPYVDRIDETMIMDIVLCDLMVRRMTGRIARDGILVDAPAFGTNDNEVIDKVIEHPLMESVDRFQKRKDRLYQQLLLTPEMEAKYKKKTSGRHENQGEIDSIIAEYTESDYKIQSSPK